MNDNQFEICVKKGINFLLDDVTGLKPSVSEQLFNKLNYAIKNNAFDHTEEDNEDEDINDASVDCKYYSSNEFLSAKFDSSKSISIFHLNIHSIEKYIDEICVVLAMLEFKFKILCLFE